jgi:putative DNA methylase
MSSAAEKIAFLPVQKGTALECDFPIVEVSQVGEQESWRKEIYRQLYHIHKWWATRLGSVFRAITLGALSEPQTDIWKEFYKKHNFSGKVVLDPFMGSGTTLGEAVKLGAKAVGCDINPVSTFLVRQAFTRVPENVLRTAFERLERTIAPEIRRYYQTKDPETGKMIPVLYYFWVKTVMIPTGEEIPLFSRYVFSQNAYAKKKPKAQIVCPTCWGVIEDRYDATDLSCPHCSHRFNPQEGPASGQSVTKDGISYSIKDLIHKSGNPPKHRLYAMMALRANGEKVYLPAQDEDQALFNEAESRLKSENLPLPTLAVRPGHNTNQARGYNYNHWRDFFNPRQLLCLGLLLKAILEIEETAVQEQMLCLFSSTLEFNNLFCSFKGEGTGAVRHMFSNHILKPERTPLENSIWGTRESSGTFSTLFESRLVKAKRYLDEPFEVDFSKDLIGDRTGTKKTIASAPINVKQVGSWREMAETNHALMVLNGNSASLPLPDASVDAVITDPPYFDFVHYSELSDFFFAWLSPALKSRYAWFNRADSSDEGEVQDKASRIFARQLSLVFSECQRVMKDDGLLAFSFHHSRAEGWAAIYEAITSAKLSVVASYPVHAEFRVSNPKSAAKDPISLDAILVCKKHQTIEKSQYCEETIHLQTNAFVKKLEAAGMSISAGDRFVIAASQMLILSSREILTFEQIKSRLDDLKLRISEDKDTPINRMTNEAPVFIDTSLVS